MINWVSILSGEHHVTRYKDQIKPGDVIYFWLAGNIENRGLYGWGRVVGDGVEYYKEWGYGVDVRYEKVFSSHIPSGEIKNLSDLVGKWLRVWLSQSA